MFFDEAGFVPNQTRRGRSMPSLRIDDSVGVGIEEPVRVR
jgi:hypothetical protein